MRNIRRLAIALLIVLGSLSYAQTPASESPIEAIQLKNRPLGDPSTLFNEMDPAVTGIDFRNRYDDPEMWGARYREFTLGSLGAGVAVGDFDGDGMPDIYAVSKTGPNALFRQIDPFRFQDVTASAGVAGNPDCWATGVTAVDINDDGHLDLYLCNVNAPNQLFVNQGDGVFLELAQAYGLDITDASVMAAFSDYDRDGELDLYLLTNILDYSQDFRGRPDYLLRNNGDGSFTDVSNRAGIGGVSQGHSATWWDFNHDGWPDIYVANDFEKADKLYRNNGDGTFTDVIAETLPLIPYFSMGSDLGDINNDSLIDFFVGDMAATTHEKDMVGIAEIGRAAIANERSDSLFPMYMRNALFLNTGTERFLEIAYLNHLDASDWTWAARFGDLDNDGWNDLFITNGNIRNFMEADLLEKQNVAASLSARIRVYKNAPPYKERNLAFRNEQNLTFSNVSNEWGLDHFGISFGTAFSDLDRDGDLDIIVNGYEENLKIYRNNTRGQGVLIRLVGVSSNRYGVGSELQLETGGMVQLRQFTLARGVLSSDEPLVHFGLGERQKASLSVDWPSGHRQTLNDLKPGRLYTITEPNRPASPETKGQNYRKTAQFEEVAAQLGLDYTHRETYFNEFEGQYLLPRRLGKQGPPLAWRQHEDADRATLYIGGASGFPNTSYAFENGTFRPQPLPPEFAAKDSETLGIAVADQALYLANGGVEGGYRDQFVAIPNEPRLPRQLSLPATSTSTVASADFDGDGDLDFFVGGRSTPNEYPKYPHSYLLENRDGELLDVTEAKAPGLKTVGMVTSAIWSDADGDGQIDLLLTLDWGSVTLFRNRNGVLTNATVGSGLEHYLGWWNSIASGDFNRDGFIDYAVGNVGLNTKYLATAEYPTLLYYGDFDGSGKNRIVEAQYSDLDDNLYPIRPYSKLRYAFPSLQEKFDSFRNFAQATLEEVFSPETLDQALRIEANTLQSAVFLSDGKGGFTYQPLPRIAQIAPIYGMAAQDFNGDGFADLFVAQNSFAPEPSTGRFNGGVSMALLGDGEGGFLPMSSAESGIVISGAAKAAITADFENDGWPDLIVSQNSDKLLAYRNRGIATGNAFSVALAYGDSNPWGFGARVTVRYKDGTESLAELSSHSGYLSQSQPKLFFGYADENKPVSIHVRWPNGKLSDHAFEADTPAIRITYSSDSE